MGETYIHKKIFKCKFLRFNCTATIILQKLRCNFTARIAQHNVFHIFKTNKGKDTCQRAPSSLDDMLSLSVGGGNLFLGSFWVGMLTGILKQCNYWQFCFSATVETCFDAQQMKFVILSPPSWSYDFHRFKDLTLDCYHQHFCSNTEWSRLWVFEDEGSIHP